MEDVKDARKDFVKRSKNFSSNAYGGLIYEDNTLNVIGNHPCHGFLGTTYYPSYQRKGNPIKYVLSAIKVSEINDQALANDFYTWLFNDSPWASVFVEKSYQQALELGILARVDVPGNLLATAMMASRFLTETYASDQKYRRPIYKELRSLGFSPIDSFLFAHLFMSNNPEKRLYPIKFARFSSGHSVFYANDVGEGYFRNFLNNTPANLTAPLGQAGYTNGTLNALWGKSGKNDHFGTWCSNVKPLEKLVGQDHHIFRAKPKNQVLVKDGVGFREVVEQIKERIYA